jgi:RNA-directed DNA polymerase
MWRTFLTTRGLPSETVDLYLGYIKPLIQTGVPVIFDFEHLAKLLGRTLDFMGKATAKPSHFYRVFQIPKKSGGSRTISAPYGSLKECQRWINDEILARVPIHPAAIGYVKERSILDHASRHSKLGSTLLIADLEQFFPSITKARVIGLFRSFGYNIQVSIALTNLCCLDDCLPQGSPASPAISNLICRRLDGRLSGLATKLDLNYSRYADDLCLSGHQIPEALTALLERAVVDSGFRLNKLKTRRVSMHSTNKVITGLNVNTGAPRLPKSTRRELQHAMHFIDKFGYLSHCSKLKIKDSNYIDKLRGRLEFWRFVEPENADVTRYIGIISKLQNIHRGQ